MPEQIQIEKTGGTEETPLQLKSVESLPESTLDAEIERLLNETVRFAESKVRGCGCGGNWV